MSGHSKWSTIKHQKGVADARRGQLFTKLAREIIVTVRQGGSDPETNARLRLAIQKARDNNMPTENIERAIKRGSGELEETTLTEMVLEAYGPGGAAILIEVLTDNRNRTLQEIRNIFSRSGGSLGESGSVAWLFDLRGLIVVETKDSDSEELTLQAIDTGAEDVSPENGYLEIYTQPGKLEEVRKALEERNIHVTSAGLAKVAKTTIELEERATLQTLKLLHKLEELDETQSVSSNVNFPDSILKKYQQEA